MVPYHTIEINGRVFVTVTCTLQTILTVVRRNQLGRGISSLLSMIVSNFVEQGFIMNVLGVRGRGERRVCCGLRSGRGAFLDRGQHDCSEDGADQWAP